MKSLEVQPPPPPPPPPQSRGTKTKNGCRTCKIRRIKCDEARPRCFRCLKTGRNCDGYANDPVPVGKLSLPTTIGLHPTLSEPDVRAFDYFKQKALLGLMGFDYTSDFWTRTVPQLSEASPAVHRAALALSTRHEHIYNNHSALPASESDLRTLKQYNKSIQQLCFNDKGQPIHITLTCCILFICLENLAGNSTPARLHLSNGLRVLKEWHSRELTSASERHLREQITLVFCRFDMQATALQGTREPELDPSFLGGNSTKYQQIPDSFSSIYVAQTALERLELRLLYVLSTYSFANPPSWSDDNYLQTKIDLLLDLRMGFSKWRRTFDQFCVKHSQTMKTRELQLSVLLSMHHQTTTLMLDIKYSTGVGPGTTVAENYRFTTINNLARSLINSASKNGASFSADMGIIPPVFFVAMGAPDRNIRRDSIQLLKKIKDREGFWNADTTARIAEGVLALEGSGALAAVADVKDEQALPQGDTAASRARIR